MTNDGNTAPCTLSHLCPAEKEMPIWASLTGCAQATWAGWAMTVCSPNIFSFLASACMSWESLISLLLMKPALKILRCGDK